MTLGNIPAQPALLSHAVGPAYESLYQAVEGISNSVGELSQLYTLLNLPGQSALKELLMDTDPLRFVTLFAPSDDAVKELLQEIGRDNLAVADLDRIQVRQTMSDTIKFHVVEFFLPSSDFPPNLPLDSSIDQHPTLLDRCVF